MSRRFPAPRLGAAGDRVELDPPTSHHLLRVCLLPRGTELRVFHAGLECRAVLVEGREGVAVVELLEAPRPVPPGPPCELLFGLLRKPALERVLRMGTELGVTRFSPFPGRHSVARKDKLERWERIVSEAARQCERAEVPSVRAPQPLPELLSEGPGLVLVPGAARLARQQGPLRLLIGPEGGLHAEEIDAALAAGFRAAGLGDTLLRADTAAVAAVASYRQD